MLSRLPLLVALVAGLASGCSPGHGGRVDGSCADGPADRSEVTAVEAATGIPRWGRSLPHPREDPPEATAGHVLLRGCGALVLDGLAGRTVSRGPEAGLVGLSGGFLVLVDDEQVVRAEPLRGRGGLSASSVPEYDEAQVAGDLVLAMRDDSVSAFRTAGSAQQAWRLDLVGLGRPDVMRDPDALVLRSAEGSVRRVDPSSGRVAWRALPAAPETEYGRLLALGPREVVVAGADGVVAALDLRDGTERWRAEVGDAATRGTPWAVASGVAAVPGADEVSGLDLRTGRRLWTVPVESMSPVAASGLLVLDDETSAVALDPRTGTVVWRRGTAHRPLLGADPTSGLLVLLDSPPVAHGYDDCC